MLAEIKAIFIYTNRKGNLDGLVFLSWQINTS